VAKSGSVAGKGVETREIVVFVAFGGEMAPNPVKLANANQISFASSIK
jgi:hypothetical protein